MIQLQVISGKQAGSEIAPRRFPFVIGRAAEAQLKLHDPGVWDHHVEITYERREGFSFNTQPSATLLVNGERVESGKLRNGDLLQLGSVQVRFWLAPSKQKTMRVREALTWTALIALFGAQIWLIYALLH
ncbi:MAG TPA: FHA domain-containing protein [Longimicrobiales bacterium]|nr:FHA domain-containing protein [Longimicrobiales bacterium]